jgi:exopolysaccharide biosynthesis polyprenyl glycosylphosphotransferase
MIATRPLKKKSMEKGGDPALDPASGEPLPSDGARVPSDGARGEGERSANEAALSGFAYLWYHKGPFLAVMDYLAIVCSFMFAFFVRHKTSLMPLPFNREADVFKYFTMAVFLAMLWVLILWLFRSYKGRTERQDDILVQVGQLLISGGLAACVLVVAAYLERSIFLSRAVYLIAVVSALPVMVVARLFIGAIEKDLVAMKVDVIRILAAGFRGRRSHVAERFSSGGGPTRFLGFVGIDGEDDGLDGKDAGEERFDLPLLGSLSDIPRLYEDNPFDMLIVCSTLFSNGNSEEMGEVLTRIVNFCETRKITLLYDLSHAFGEAADGMPTETLSGITLPGTGRGTDKKLRSAESAEKRALIIGFNQRGRTVLDRLLDSQDGSCKIVGFISTNSNRIGKTYRDVPVVADLAQLKSKVKDLKVDEVIVAFGTSQQQSLLDVVALTRGSSASVRIIPGRSDFSGTSRRHSMIGDIPLLPVNPQILGRWDLFFKRIFDFSAAATGLILFTPAFPFLAMAIKLDSRGAIFYSQERVGRSGRTFRIYKLRTMAADAEKKSGPTWSSRNDPRITRCGGFLRKMRLDEIPQLWNVLINDMSLVGPRPERPFFVNQFLEKFPLYRYRLKLKPGVTGWAQVRGKYDESSDDVEKKLLLDLYYMENYRLSMDMRIILETVRVVFTAKGQ